MKIFLNYLHAGCMMTIRRMAMTVGVALCASLLSLHGHLAFAQSSGAKQRILIDIAHGQKFYNDPADMAGQDSAQVQRIKYMNAELAKNAAALNAEVGYLKKAITPDALAKCDLLFVHMPSSKFTAEEVDAIQKYIQKGGSLFLVMEVDYWATLAQVNVNDILSPFGIVFKMDNPDNESSGGHTRASKVTGTRYRIPYHGARIVEGGTPFCFSDVTEDHPFGVYKEVKNGGRIIAMGDGMVSLYMTSWKDVHDYQCSPFMQDAFAWLLKLGKPQRTARTMR